MFLRSGPVGDSLDDDILVVIGAVVKIAQIQIGFGIQDEPGVEVGRPLIIPCIEKGLGVIGGRCLGGT